MASPFLEFDLTRELEQLHGEATWRGGRNARTLMKYPDLRVVLTALQAGARIPEHKTDARVSVHVLSGHLRMNAGGRTFDLRSGSVLALDHGLPHDVEALEESAFLLTVVLAPAPAAGGADGR
jgi:quercetin dioxygenase-like cupin family protein